VDVEDDTIRLAQFLKLAGAIDSGGEAKVRIAAGEVLVNGEVEVRRGRQLRRGDVVDIDDQRLRIR
jgi:ribosome-associated protein